MDLLQQIKAKLVSDPHWAAPPGLKSVLTHVEVAERYHVRARTERDEHLYTDVIYRTNHAYEGILREAYELFAGKPADKLSTYEIEDYLLANAVLRARVADLLKNYRQHWRNPSTHDHQLFFSEQESFLAIVNVCAFVSILLDQMLERVAYERKKQDLEKAALLARDAIKDFSEQPLIDKVWHVLLSFAAHYIKRFPEMSALPRSVATAQMAAFVEQVAPELKVTQEASIDVAGRTAYFDLLVQLGQETVAIETRDPRSRDIEGHFATDAAMDQLMSMLRAAGLQQGVLFQFPGAPDDQPVATTRISDWPKDLSLRIVYGADPEEFNEDEASSEKPVDLVPGQG